MLWILSTASKQALVRIIPFILTTFNNEQPPCRHMKVDEDGALEKSTDFTDLLVGKFNTSLETNDGYSP